MQHLPIHPTKRHPLTGAPLQAIWVRPDGRAMWPILGASPDDPSNDPPPSDDPPADDPPPKDWEAEFTAQRKINRKLERDSKPWFDALKEHGLSADDALDILKKAKAAPPKGDDPEPVDAEKVRREALREATEQANARLVRAEVRALAAEGFANPADALHNLDLSEYEVDEDGELTDAAKVKADLAEVLRQHPHYAKKGAGPKPDHSQGPRGDGKTDPGPGMARLRHAYANSSK